MSLRLSEVNKPIDAIVVGTNEKGQRLVIAAGSRSDLGLVAPHVAFHFSSTGHVEILIIL